MEQQILPQFLFFADIIIFLSVIVIHLTEKNISVIYLYALQSLVVATLVFYAAIIDSSYSMILVATLIFLVKVVVAPRYFSTLINKHQIHVSDNNYLNLPLTVAAIAIITMTSQTRLFLPLITLAPLNQNALFISIATIFVSLFLIINRKGALSQMIGILCLENAVFSFIFAAGLGQGPGLELGIIFDVSVWILIASTFITMVYKKFGTLDVTAMTDLKG